VSIIGSRQLPRTLAIATVLTILLVSKTFFLGTLTLNPIAVLGLEASNNNNDAVTTTTLINPTINRISDIVYNAAAASSSSSSNYISKQDLERTVSQIILLAQVKAGQDKAQQFLSNIAEQVALNPKGSVSQSLIRFAQEDDQARNMLLDQTISAALATNAPIPTALTIAAVLTINGATQNTIDTTSKYLSSSTGIGAEVYQEVLQQLALRISNTDGKYKADDIINYQLPREVLQANTGQMVQPLSSFAWNLRYGHINTFDEGLSDVTIGVLRGNTLQSSLIGVPFGGGNIYGGGSSSGIGGSIYAPSSPLGSYGEGYQPPSSLGSETPQQDLRSMDTMSESSSGQGQSNSPSDSNDNGGDNNNNTPQQDLRSMDSGNGGDSFPSSNSDDASGGGGAGLESSDGGSTPQEDLRSMDS
jgi:hypothetical protein